jgi:hypothetical protein
MSRTSTFATLRRDLTNILAFFNTPSLALPPVPKRSPSEYVIDYCQGPCDMILKCGKGKETRKFKLNSIWLAKQSDYFEKCVHNKWRKKGDKYYVEKCKVRPSVIETLLR